MINSSTRQSKAVVFFLGLALAGLTQAQMPNSSSSDEARVYFVQPADGQVFDGQDAEGIEIIFGLTGMQVSPAGIAEPNSGHHHLLINVEKLPDLTNPLPATDQVRHFGKGQTEVQLNLTPGEHTLTLQFADGIHTSYGEAWSKTITVNVN